MIVAIFYGEKLLYSLLVIFDKNASKKPYNHEDGQKGCKSRLHWIPRRRSDRWTFRCTCIRQDNNGIVRLTCILYNYNLNNLNNLNYNLNFSRCNRHNMLPLISWQFLPVSFQLLLRSENRHGLLHSTPNCRIQCYFPSFKSSNSDQIDRKSRLKEKEGFLKNS